MTKVQKQFNGEWVVFSTNDLEATGHPPIGKNMNLHLYFTAYTKNNLKCHRSKCET